MYVFVILLSQYRDKMCKKTWHKTIGIVKCHLVARMNLGCVLITLIIEMYLFYKKRHGELFDAGCVCLYEKNIMEASVKLNETE